MNRRRDAWYVLLPNGQEIKAKSTAAVLHHLQTGAIPKTSRARRSRDEEWTLLEWHAEFTEATTGIARPKPDPDSVEFVPEPKFVSAKPSEPLAGVAARLDPMMLRTVGVRGLMDDLIAALDSTFAPGKLLVAAVTAGLIGLVWGGVPWALGKVLAQAGIMPAEFVYVWVVRGATLALTVFAIVMLALANALLTRMTHLELSTMKRMGVRPALRGFFSPALRLVIAYLVILGGAFFVMAVLHALPNLVVSADTGTAAPALFPRVIAAAISVVGLLIEVVLWLLIGLSWLLAPILVGEDFPLFAGIGEWFSLIRSQFNRIVLAQTLTLAVGALVAAPFVLPVDFALGHYPHLPAPVRTALYALTLAGFLAFVAVANVFTYLDVKYEQPES